MRQPFFDQDVQHLAVAGMPRAMPSIETVFEFAKMAHQHQVRKYTNEPYIWHPLDVATQVATQLRTGHKGILLYRGVVAALLHDTVEDTAATFTDIEREFGEQAACDVFYLTDPVDKAKGNRATRGMLSRELMSRAPPIIKCVKMCDMVSNLRSIAEHDAKFSITYTREKMDMFNSLGTEIHQMFPIITANLQQLMMDNMLTKED